MIFPMFVALTLAVAPGQSGPNPRLAVFEQACLGDLPATREGLAAVASRNGWRKIATATPEDVAWRDHYAADQATVRLDQYLVMDGNPGERICTVSVGEAPSRWNQQVSAMTAGGAKVGEPTPYDTDVYQLQPGLELTMWILPDGSRIHALRTPDNMLELSVNYPTGR